MNCVGHVIGEEKYEWVILNVLIRRSNIEVGIVYWARLSGSFLGMFLVKTKLVLTHV